MSAAKTVVAAVAAIAAASTGPRTRDVYVATLSLGTPGSNPLSSWPSNECGRRDQKQAHDAAKQRGDSVIPTIGARNQ